MGFVIAIAIIAALILLALMFMYNGLVRMRNQVKNAWAQIDVQLKRRHDLIPNLINTVKGYAKHEQGTLEKVIQARNAAIAATGAGAAGKAESQPKAALGGIFALAEQYPDLKANQNFLALQEELTSTENKIGFARQFYNDQVMGYNTKIQSVPTNLIASKFGFWLEDMFELADSQERDVPNVSFE